MIASGYHGLRRHAGHGDALAADPGLEQDLGAELFDDFDAGIEAGTCRAFAEYEMFRPHPQDHLAAMVEALAPIAIGTTWNSSISKAAGQKQHEPLLLAEHGTP